jgi:tRNA nucleotidyltransferase (CCA-adding enzyme)
MKIYLVGGAVRDQLLGYPHKEKDWVVVNATTEDMLKLGYRQVGKDFPVFLHPETNEEYALARTERKVGRGYTGFAFDTSTHVTLEEDLKRRDLTINAMAKDLETGQLVDPYGGQKDLAAKMLRHVSPAFAEDPVRVLRVARFAARYGDFTVATDTNNLMKQMVESGEVDALVPERVWKELERALGEKFPHRFFEVLKDCSAFARLFPESVMQCITNLKKAEDSKVRFAALFLTATEKELQHFCERYKVPVDYKELALLVVRYHTIFSKNSSNLTADEALEFLNATDAFRRENRFDLFLEACQTGAPLSKVVFWKKCFDAVKAINAKEFIEKGFSGKDIAEQMNIERKKKLEIYLKETPRT